MLSLKSCELCNKRINHKTVYCAYDFKCCSVYCQTSIINLNNLYQKNLNLYEESVKKYHIQLIRKLILKKIKQIRGKKLENYNIYKKLEFYSLLEL